MKKLERIAGIIFVIAFTMKMNLIFGSSILILLSLSIIACIYYPLGFAFFNNLRFKDILKKESYIGISSQHIARAVSVGLALSAICVGIIFKLLQWKGANSILIVGLTATLVALIISLYQYNKTKDNFYSKIVKRIAIVGGFGLIMLSVSDLAIVKIQFRNHPRYIKAYETYLTNKEDIKLRNVLTVEYYRATMSKEEFESSKDALIMQ